MSETVQTLMTRSDIQPGAHPKLEYRIDHSTHETRLRAVSEQLYRDADVAIDYVFHPASRLRRLVVDREFRNRRTLLSMPLWLATVIELLRLDTWRVR